MYRVQVGNTDFFIDLLFYNRALPCLVPIELKTGKIKPEHIGQINFYLEALDRFSRDRYDSAHYKHILKKNCVKVVSVKEHISEGPGGIILEAMPSFILLNCQRESIAGKRRTL